MIGKPRIVAFVLASASTLVVANQTRADTVYLTNGKKIENCTTERDGDIFHVEVSGSVLDLPAGRIERIEKSKVTPDSAKLDGSAREERTLAERVADVLPDDREDWHLRIPWRTDLLEARAEAAQVGKPIFLWLMNGNPLGAT